MLRKLLLLLSLLFFFCASVSASSLDATLDGVGTTHGLQVASDPLTEIPFTGEVIDGTGDAWPPICSSPTWPRPASSKAGSDTPALVWTFLKVPTRPPRVLS